MRELHVAVDDGSVADPVVQDNPVHPGGETNARDPGKTLVIPFNPDGIPGELKALPHWVGWDLKPRETGKKPAKVPLNPWTGRFAEPNNPKTWGTFKQAMRFYKNRGCSGLGFFFTKEARKVGIDLDGCRNPETGEVDPWALEIVQRCNSYSEISVSGKGLHIVVTGVLPGEGKNQGGIEIYDDRRYFAMTGVLLTGANSTIENRQDVVLDLYFQLRGEQAARVEEKGVGEQVMKLAKGNWEALIPELRQAELTPAGEEILRGLAAGRYGELYRLLYLGDWEGAGRLRKAGPYRTISQADMALINFLCRLTDGNPGLVYAIIKET